MSIVEEIKKTGATFTPRPLADFLSSRIVALLNPGQSISILDPACGDGELLLSISTQLKNAGCQFSLSGYDSNKHYLSSAQLRLQKFDNQQINLISGDFLDSVNLPKQQFSIGFDGGSQIPSNQLFDVIIANPPYVRTQVLGSEIAQKLAQKFNLKGRVDLYYAFLIAMTNSLKDNGILGVITSNRYLSTKSGESVRKFLTENYNIVELIDLGDTKLFDAAVLPALLIARRKTDRQLPSPARFIKLYEELNGYRGDCKPVATIYDILNTQEKGYFRVNEKRYKKTAGTLTFDTANGWEMLSEAETEWTSRVDAAATCRIGSLVKVKVGIKTTADRVFIRDDWQQFGEAKPEDELLKNLISQENIQAWGATGNIHLKVLYPHFSLNGTKQTIVIGNYPKAAAYLQLHEEQLRSRKYLIDAGREWFEIWVPHHPNVWDLPKLVFPDISASPRFCFDTKGNIVNGNCYWIAAKTAEEARLLLLIQGVANSKLMTKYHDLAFNNKLYSGRRRYLSQYVERYPLPNPNSPVADRIISLVKQLNACDNPAQLTELAYELEVAVGEAFNVDPIHHLEQAGQFEIQQEVVEKSD